MRTRTCVCCLKDRVYECTKQYSNGNGYTDENGHWWSGVYCPVCVSNGERRKHRDRRKREEEKLMARYAQYGTDWDKIE